MQINNARSVSEALSRGLHALRVAGQKQPSRVGDVLVLPYPMLTVYSDPTNRVLLSPIRDANPFFHVMESLWMLAGRNDLPWLVRFNKRFSSYSDDGGLTQPGAYGYRWRNYFGHDQLEDAILELLRNPSSRRVVISMWDGGARCSWNGTCPSESQPGDSYAAVGGSADVPCNTHIYFDTINGKLNMTVCCRSNDILWGAHGANAVHFSFLLEYMSARTGLAMGVYRQFSNNYHLYTNTLPEEQMMPLSINVEDTDPYLKREAGGYRFMPMGQGVHKVPLVSDPSQFDAELGDFMHENEDFKNGAFHNSFFTDVAIPMYKAHAAYRERDYDTALRHARHIVADDWRSACTEWLTRRKIKAEQNTKPFTEVVENGPN